MYNIYLITIDTWRHDSFNQSMMPKLYNWSRNKVIFTNCYSHSPWTRPAFASLLTGQFPFQHRCIKNTRTLNDLQQNNISYDTFLSLPSLTLAQQLKALGYSTVCIQGNTTIAKGNAYGLDKGFDVYTTPSNPNAKWLTLCAKSYRPTKPILMWVNYMDCHSPYEKSSKSVYSNPKFHLDVELDEDDKDIIKSRYYSNPKFLDSYIYDFISTIDLENSVVIITSDHGEELFEHGSKRDDNDFYSRGIDHGHTLYDELIKVPLIIHHPKYIKPCISKSICNHIQLYNQIIGWYDYKLEFADYRPILHFAEAICYGEERKCFIIELEEKIYKIIFSRERVQVYDLWNEYRRIIDNALLKKLMRIIELSDIELDWFDAVTEVVKHRDLVEDRLRNLGYID